MVGTSLQAHVTVDYYSRGRIFLLIVEIFVIAGLIMDFTASTRMKCRRRPLHTWGVSTMAIAHKACVKAQHLNEPLGSMAKRIVTLGSQLVSSILYVLQHFWLAIFLHIDDCILAFENVVEAVFPPSRHVFNKVDEIVQIIETLPRKFDDILNEFPVIIERVPLLDWALGQSISWLKLLTSILTHCVSENTKEKEIVVDRGYNEINDGVSSSAAATVNEAKLPIDQSPGHVGLKNNDKFPPTSEEPKTEAHSEKVSDQMANPIAAKGTYKEVLERGKRENMEKKEHQRMQRMIGIQTILIL